MTEAKIYPESRVELNPFVSKHYDRFLGTASLGYYPRAIKRAIDEMDIRPGDHILDLGCGTGLNTASMTAHLNGQGSIHGLDISDEMARQFKKRFTDNKNITFQNQRVDIPFQLDRKFNKVFISLVLHGFPHDVRLTVIRNAINHLEAGGSFHILDFSEFDMDSMPFLHRAIFKAVECPYAFDYIERDWKSILREQGFKEFREHFFLRKYMRLLRADI